MTCMITKYKAKPLEFINHPYVEFLTARADYGIVMQFRYDLFSDEEKTSISLMIGDKSFAFYFMQNDGVVGYIAELLIKYNLHFKFDIIKLMVPFSKPKRIKIERHISDHDRNILSKKKLGKFVNCKF